MSSREKVEGLSYCYAVGDSLILDNFANDGILTFIAGPPGVGKTLTAESVAEEMRVPLFMISSGDLGLSPRSIEKQLQEILDMCTRWNAILLLDEADVFLEERSLHELERNKLVTIFLRVLEYYEGIMFLTTNRVETFDAAFQSRIHISLEYKELDAKSREAVWQNFLKQHDIAQAAARERPPRPLATAAKAHLRTSTTSPETLSSSSSADDAAAAQKAYHHRLTLPHAITPRDMVKLAALNMNGRQIKNILKTAQLLASQRGEGLSYHHIDTVMDVTQHLHNAGRESRATKSSLFS
jgi:SpoVK/Ycf46/Vps4 family AAA+-type ATPase